MLTPFTKLKTMTAKQLHNTLMAEYPDSVEKREEIKAKINTEREDKRVLHIKREQHRKVWSPLIYQAYKAINTPMARVRKAQALYDSPMGYGSAYEEAFEESPSARVLATYKAYSTLLQKAADKLRAYRDAGTHTPKQLAKEKGIPNEGEHWSDWIPEQIKAATERAFALLHEDDPMTLFPRTFYAPVKAKPYKPRKTKPKPTRTRPMSRVEQIRAALREADTRAMAEPTPENVAQRDALILEKEAAMRERRREHARKYNAKIRAELREWRKVQKQLEGEAK